MKIAKLDWSASVSLATFASEAMQTNLPPEISCQSRVHLATSRERRFTRSRAIETIALQSDNNS